MININIQVDIDSALKKLSLINGEVANKATMRAINRIAEQAKTSANREIRGNGYAIKKADIDAAMRLVKASAKELRAVLKAVGRPIPLIYFSPVQKKNGVTVSVKKGRKLIPHAFICTYKGKLRVCERVDGGKIRVKYLSPTTGQMNNMQFPIRELFGPSIPSVFMNESVQSALEAMIRDKFPARFSHELKNLLRK